MWLPCFDEPCNTYSPNVCAFACASIFWGVGSGSLRGVLEAEGDVGGDLASAFVTLLLVQLSMKRRNKDKNKMPLNLANLKPLFGWVRNFKTKETLRIDVLPRSLFGCPVRPDIIHRVAIWYRTGLRAGNASTKERGDVRGSRRKIRPQKGTGKARVGDARTPNRRGGGICFGPKPKDWAYHLQNKVVNLGFRSAMAAKYLQNEVMIVTHESLSLPFPTPTYLSSLLREKYAEKNKFLVVDSSPPSDEWTLAARSLNNVVFMSPRDDINAYHLMDNKLIIITTRALSYYAKKMAAQ